MVAICCALAALLSTPMAAIRSAPWPTSGAILMAMPARFGGLAVALQIGPGQCHGVVADTGEQVQVQLQVLRIDRKRRKPQLPVTSVVTPWLTLLWARPSSIRLMSEWVWMSMKPGDTTRPLASITSRCADRSAVADKGDAPGHDADIGLARRGTGAVDHQAAADEGVCLHRAADSLGVPCSCRSCVRVHDGDVEDGLELVAHGVQRQRQAAGLGLEQVAVGRLLAPRAWPA
jgi:hypothetical protein